MIVAALTGRLASAPSAMNAASWSSARNTYDGPAEIGNVATSAPITGPDFSVMTEDVTTNAAVIAMRSASVSRKESSGDIIGRPCERRDPYAAAYRFQKVSVDNSCNN